MAAFLPLHSDRKSELRDPTLEELYTGPIRALPDEIQQLPDEDTACTFCGVSYFIFAEVQTLQTTVKQYKKAFRDFVQFLEHERSVAQNLRQQAIELKSGFAELVMTCSSTITQFSEQNKAHCSAKQEALEQVLRLQKELFESKTQCQDLHFLCQRNEASQNTHALTEQELRNEISQLTLQVMNCKAQIQSQQELFEEEHSRNQQRIRDFESKFVEWTTIERQNGAERDDLKQKLETMSQRVELEASQMELELAALRKERDQVVASRDSEREVSSVEISNLKNQLSSLDMMRLQLVSENGRYKDITLKLEDEIAALRLAADQMHGQLSVSTKYNENVKENLIRDLEKAREKYEKEIDSLQQGHAQAIEELKFCQNERMEIEKQKTVELASQREQTSREAFLAIENRLQDTERRANEWRDRALQNAREIEEMKRNGLDHETLNQTLQNQLDQSLRDKLTSNA
ncbi:uncharacterized protein PHALS_08230 [Plasmopara halstedii]|uniref:Uncharacterized protein n=1 Tax=Plasmopara halstedii TaxID=4781 RepID=A0A0P1AC16_PLAHL|nr:uncharacterized protein PHALS_08230 [Plasmopara halstedii]CEG38140.1 hypothetical protein PHALS_08230 [Plasmopara halstedii]|eukprot:XP_024574509.1 hypothetical protein PHALS_08230 [Plasmopara halstedii]